MYHMNAFHLEQIIRYLLAEKKTMKTCIRLSNTQPTQLPAEFQEDDVRFSESFAQHFIRQYSKYGDVVFDPFAGFGTTLVVAEALGRVPSGIEYDIKRVEYIRSRLQRPEQIIQGDSRRLADYDLPRFDLSLTSPPYMSKNDPEDPFTAYSQTGRGYAGYLEDIRQIYTQMRLLMKPGARAVIEVSNLKDGGEVTTLAWDIARAVSEVLVFQGEIVIEWEPTYGYGYDHSYALVFSE